MSIGKVAVLVVALALVSGGVGAALADGNSPEPGPVIELVDVDARIEDDADGTLVPEPEDDDGAPPTGNDAPPLRNLAGTRNQRASSNEPADDKPQAALAPAQPVPAGASDSDDVGAASDDTGGESDDAGAGGGGGDDDGGDD